MSRQINKKVLFVDDEHSVLDAISRQLHKKFDLETADGGFAGLEAIAARGPFAVVISDLKMADMGGLEFLRRVGRISPESVCVMLTGHADMDVAVQAVNEGRIFRFLSKPCETEILVETLKDSLEQYRKLSSVTSYTYSADLVEGELEWKERSHGCEAVTGYSHQDIVRDSELWFDMVDREHRKMAKVAINRLLAGGDLMPLEFKIRRKDGEIRWVRDAIIPRHDEAGNVIGIEGLVEDITEQKEVEEALKRSEKRYQRMVGNVPGLVYQLVLHEEGQIEFEFVSDSCRDLFGIDSLAMEDDAGLLFDRIDAKDRCSFYRRLGMSAENLKSFEWWGSVNVRGQQRVFQAVASPERVGRGDVMFDGLLMDMTEYRKIEEQVRSLAKFPGEDPNPVLRIASDGEILYANRAAGAVLELWDVSIGGTAPEDIKGKVMLISGTGKHKSVEVESGGRVYSLVFASTHDSDYVNIYGSDITAIKAAEKELIVKNEQLEAHDRMKNEFVTTVSHELRTPLCIFKNIVSNAMAGALGKVSKKLYKSLKMADEGIDRLSRIINDFLDISKIEAGMLKLDPSVFSINELVENVVTPMTALADAKGIEVKIDCCRQEMKVNADRDRIAQVITNLVGNSIKFVPVNGHIRVCVSDQGDNVRVCVDDDGPGLDKEEMETVFDRFVQVNKPRETQENGTGLGLAITKELVEMHNGTLWVDSMPGKGCCFSFALPKALEMITAG